MFIMFKRKGKFFTFTNMDKLVWLTQEEIVSMGLKAYHFKSDLLKRRNLVASKTAAHFANTSRAKNASRAKENATSSPNIFSNISNASALSTLEIKTPTSPQLEHELGRWKNCSLNSLNDVWVHVGSDELNA